MLVLFVSALLLIGAPASILVMGRLIERATKPRPPRSAAPAERQQPAGTEWFYRPMRPGFGRLPPMDPPIDV